MDKSGRVAFFAKYGRISLSQTSEGKKKIKILLKEGGRLL